MVRRLPLAPAQSATETTPIVRLWMLRVLIDLGKHRNFISENGFFSDKLAYALGLGGWIDGNNVETYRMKVLAQLHGMHRELEANVSDIEIPHIPRSNVDRLSNPVGLSATDCRILEFAVMIRNEAMLDDVCEQLGTLSSSAASI
jgi:hypothetical protein